MLEVVGFLGAVMILFIIGAVILIGVRGANSYDRGEGGYGSSEHETRKYECNACRELRNASDLTMVVLQDEEFQVCPEGSVN